jgi:hypothetical protein
LDDSKSSQLSGGFPDLKVGALEESVTVSGASPVVDVNSTARVTVLTRDTLDSIPTGRTMQSVGQPVVGVTLSSVLQGRIIRIGTQVKW